MRKGFTLSEVLIALGIIGVIAAMTLPSVIKHYQQQVTVNKLKKVYTELNQAFKMSEIDNDTYENWSTIEEIGMTAYVNKYWKPYLKKVKICNNPAKCGYTKDLPWQNAINSQIVGRTVKEGGFILNDGTLVTVHTNTAIMIDLNAGNSPNRYGRDFFEFKLSKAGIKACGEQYATANTYCSKTFNDKTNGESCAGKIVRDGWKIKDDYPW